MHSSASYALFITCPRGLETILTQELANLGGQKIQSRDGGVAAQGDLATVYRINLYSRVASRVLIQLTHAKFSHEQDIYQIASQIHWPEWFNVNQHFKIHVEGKHARVNSLNFAALKVKDALCDVFRQQHNARPSVEKFHPDVRIHVFIEQDTLAIYLDTSGEALFKRGYRQETGEAPLRENLAAGLLLLAGYDGSQPFLDPFCGSGTLAIEAALIACNRAPGIDRSFGFEQLKNYDAALWSALHQKAQQTQHPATVAITGSDIDAGQIKLAQNNARHAEVASYIQWQRQDVRDSRPNGTQGILISNPPYGVRLSEIQQLHALYPQLGSWLKQYFAGWLIGLFTADRDMPKLMRLSPKRKIPLFNGNLDCRLFLLDMVAGSHRQQEPKA
ncbi:THUMP domain-containing protein [Neisseriaceae bacterium ESL0693]|nr:THUMP domain-containing protein [Neisseriaceae bacterium ESL0693]